MSAPSSVANFDVSRGHLDANLPGKPILQTVLGRYDAEMQFSHMECSFGLADCLNNAQRPLQKIGDAEADFGPCRFDIVSISPKLPPVFGTRASVTDSDDSTNWHCATCGCPLFCHDSQCDSFLNSKVFFLPVARRVTGARI
jgi:hypothetical protein